MPAYLKLLAILSTTVVAAGCGALFDFEQCTTNEECGRFDGTLVCSSDNICVEPGGAQNQGSCSNTECAANDANSVCGAEGTCVSVLTPECTSILLPDNRENMILFGSIQPTTGDAASAGIPQEEAIILALREFNESGKIQDLRFGLVGCDSAGDTAQGVAAAEHLANTLGLPALMGPAFSGIFIEATTAVTVPAGVMNISGSATSEAITEIPDDGLAWRTIASDSFQSVAIADRVRDLRTEFGGQIKVAAFGKDDAYGKGLLFAVGAALETELGEDNYFGIVHPNTADAAADIPGTVATALTNNFSDADVVLLLGTQEVLDVLQSYESILDDQGSTSAPLYIFSDGGKISATVDLVAADNSLAGRIEGTIPSLENGANYVGFKQRYSAEYGADPNAFASNAYDAAYLLSYAGATLVTADQPLTGANFASMMARLVEGQVVQAGPADIGAAINTLSAGANINYEGASGLLAFDLTTGEAPSDVNRWVVEIRGPDDLRFLDDGRYEVAADGTGTWVGIGK